MREQLAQDPYMRDCVILGGICEGRIQWHHAFKYAGKRVNEIWALLPVCENHHKEEAKWRGWIEECLRERIKHFGAEADFRKRYPKSTLLQVINKWKV